MTITSRYLLPRIGALTEDVCQSMPRLASSSASFSTSSAQRLISSQRISAAAAQSEL